MVRVGLKGGQLRLFSRDQVERVHATSLRILEEVGCTTNSDRILKVFEEGGAEIDRKEKRVRIHEELVKEALKKAPKSWIVCGRNPEYDVLVEGNQVHFGCYSCGVHYIVDLDTRERRRPTTKDLVDATRLADALENIALNAVLFDVSDLPRETEYEHQWALLFSNTVKPFHHFAPSAYIAKNVIEMAEAVAGGAEELRKRPIGQLVIEVTSPLFMPAEMEGGIEWAKAGLPLGSAPAPMAGMTGPATQIGTIALNNAENLATVVMIQLVNPGTPIYYNNTGSVVQSDPFGRPGGRRRMLTDIVLNAQLGEYYGLPKKSATGISNAKIPDAQAGAEAAMTTMISALAGSNLTFGLGEMWNFEFGSLEMTVIGDEIYRQVANSLEEVRVDDESLAFDVIREVGPGGSFLGHKHTLKHIANETYVSKLYDRTYWDEWVKAGRKDILQVARERVKKILNEHQPEPLPKHIQQEISNILKRVDRERVGRV